MTDQRSHIDKVVGLSIRVVAVALVLYQMVTPYYFFVTPTEHLNIHLGFALTLVFLVSLRGAKKNMKPVYAVLLLLSLACVFYIGIFNDELVFQVGDPFPPVAIILISTILIVVCIEANREVFGLTMPVFITFFLVYCLLGHLVPGYFGTSYVRPVDVISRLGIGALGVSGIYGLFLGVSANDIFLFVVFGSLLQVTGATRFFNEVGKLVSRKLAGGAGLSAVVTSALVGMVTGSVTANVVTTGSFTIPFMKKFGYRPEQAGAIEAAASTGGQIMPPVMGSAAFLLAAFVGIPYIEVAKMAAIPAVLYFLCVGLYVQFNGIKLNLSPPTEEVNYKEMALSAHLFIVPLTLLIVLLIKRYSLNFAMSITIIILIAMSFIRKETRPSLSKLIDGLTDGGVAGAQVAVICASLGIVESIITWRGIGFKIPKAFYNLSGGNLILGLLFTMIASLLLGMGVPTSAAYLVVAMTTAPALMKFGITMIQAHLFSFYFACMSMVTPPVAIAALVAAKLAGGKFVKTGIEATKAAIGGFIVPYLIIWCPAIILEPRGMAMAPFKLTAAAMLIIAVQIVVCGCYLTKIGLVGRIFYSIIVGMLFLYLPSENFFLMGGGMALFVVATVWQLVKKRRQREQVECSVAN